MRKAPRFWQKMALQLGRCHLHDEVAHHAVKVLRLQVGQELILFNGDGNDYHASIAETTKRSQVLVEIHDITPNHTESSLRIHLGQALSRKDTMNVAVQKAVELGATSITPLICDFTDAKIDANFLSKRQQQWQKVVVGASEQSGRAILADLTPTQPLAAWLTQVQQTSLTSANTTLNLYLDVTNGNYLRILGQEHALVNQVNIAVGPEGGFSESEVTLLQDQGFTAINLGPRILRFETAAMAAIAICQSIWGDA